MTPSPFYLFSPAGVADLPTEGQSPLTDMMAIVGATNVYVPP